MIGAHTYILQRRTGGQKTEDLNPEPSFTSPGCLICGCSQPPTTTRTLLHDADAAPLFFHQTRHGDSLKGQGARLILKVQEEWQSMLGSVKPVPAVPAVSLLRVEAQICFILSFQLVLPAVLRAGA